MTWFRRMLHLTDPEKDRDEHAELVKVRRAYRESLMTSRAALAHIQPYIDREARRVEELLRTSAR